MNSPKRLPICGGLIFGKVECTLGHGCYGCVNFGFDLGENFSRFLAEIFKVPHPSCCFGRVFTAYGCNGRIGVRNEFRELFIVERVPVRKGLRKLR